MFTSPPYLPLVLIALGGLFNSPADAQSRTVSAPEQFTSAMQTRDGGAVPGMFVVRIDRYTPVDNRTKMTTALKYGGATAFLDELRKSPVVGHITLGDQKLPLRWAREEPTRSGRRITLVTDSPVAIAGRGNARPADAGAVTVVELNVDATGLGTGTLVAAARIKPNEVIGAAIDDERAERITLTTVTRSSL